MVFYCKYLDFPRKHANKNASENPSIPIKRRVSNVILTTNRHSKRGDLHGIYYDATLVKIA